MRRRGKVKGVHLTDRKRRNARDVCRNDRRPGKDGKRNRAPYAKTEDLRKREGENKPRTEHPHARARRVNPNRNAAEGKSHSFHGDFPSRRPQQPRREMRRDDTQREADEKINDHRRGKTEERERDKRKRHRTSSLLLGKKQRNAGQDGKNAACRWRQDTAKNMIDQKECGGRPPFPGRKRAAPGRVPGTAPERKNEKNERRPSGDIRIDRYHRQNDQTESAQSTMDAARSTPPLMPRSVGDG